MRNWGGKPKADEIVDGNVRNVGENPDLVDLMKNLPTQIEDGRGKPNN